ncbi:lycopene cyclase domain-containing protein [Candidatus Roizmanbacteria bacterium]|nr:lycopene cyclase domain-containing protein [Candidatus Roizmanbacteria bacterium]
MKEYLVLDGIGFFIVLLLDGILKTHVLQRKKFWIFQFICAGLLTVVDNYLSGRPIILFSPQYLLNIHIGAVPIENYLYSFSLLTLNLILFEYFKNREKK